MAAHPIKARLHPFRVLTILLYGQHEYLVRLGGRTVEAKVGPLARALRVPNYRLKEYVDWLQRTGYITEVSHHNGYFVVDLVYPRNIDNE